MLKFPKELEQKNIRQTFTGSDQSKDISASLLNIPARDAIEKVWPHFALLYLMRGEGTYINEKGKEYQLKPGHFVLRHPDRLHSVIRKQDGNWVEFAITFSRQTYNAFVDLEIIAPGTDVIHVGINQQILDKICRFITGIKNYTPKEYSLLMIDMQKLFYDISHRSNKEGIGKLVEEKIEKACIHLSENLDKKLSIPEYAEQLRLGYHHFRKEFKKTMGLSPKEYRIRKRIEAAQNMIREDLSSLKEIAADLGYPDFASFAKQYKKVTGLSPSEFRNASDI